MYSIILTLFIQFIQARKMTVEEKRAYFKTDEFKQGLHNEDEFMAEHLRSEGYTVNPPTRK